MRYLKLRKKVIHDQRPSTQKQARPGAVVPPFEGTKKGMCTGAILRARISNPENTIEPYAWGFRNPYGVRFSPADHPLKGEMMISENGEDERGARPTNNSPDRLAIARQNPDGTPGSDPKSRFPNDANAPLVQIPGTGTIWKISRMRDRHENDDDD
jgi:hypothetical protein